MDLADLQKRIDRTPALAEARDKLAAELSFRADTGVTFDPFLVIAIISIVVQIVIHCRNQRSDNDIKNTIRNIRTIPPRKLLRLRRRANKLWQEYCEQRGFDEGTENPVLAALYDLGEYVDDDALNELIALADA